MNVVDTHLIKYENGKHISTHHDIAAEEPLEIFINDRPFRMTMRLPGEEIPLAVGFLFSEGLIKSAEEILSVSHCEDGSSNRINVYLKSPINDNLQKFFSRKPPSYAGCRICDNNILSDFLCSVPKITKTLTVPFHRLTRLQDLVIEGQQVFKKTGGTHVAGIFNGDGILLALSEDIGRYNALDKAMGKVLLAKKTLEAKILILSSRLSYEMVTKAARLSIEILTGVSSATSLAVDLARRVEMTLIAFHRGQQGNIYSCSDRLILEE